MKPKSFLVSYNNSIRVLSDEKLQEILNFLKQQLNQIKSLDKETANRLSVSVEQKITLIENELKHRNQTQSLV